MFAALVAAAAIAGACSAVDDFGNFTFTDGAAGGSDLGEALPGFGQPCVDACAVGPDVSRPLMCFHMFGSRTVPGGMCTRSCSVASAASCLTLGVEAADCVTVENMDLCLPRCNPSGGRNCRTGYSCCAQHNVVTDAGDCAPSTTDLCH